MMLNDKQGHNTSRSRETNYGWLASVTEPAAYLHARFGVPLSGIEKNTEKVLTGNYLTCKTWEDKNNCTLVALHNLFSFAKKKEMISFSQAKEDLYTLILNEARCLFYKPKRGLPVGMNRLLAARIIRILGIGHIAKAKCRYLPTKRRVIKGLDKGTPLILSVGSGYYFNHTVTVCGYEVYTCKKTNRQYTFLVLSDGWRDAVRYLPWTNTGTFYITSMTQIEYRVNGKGHGNAKDVGGTY